MAMILPALATAGRIAAYSAVGYLTSNALGLNDALKTVFDPRMVTPPPASSSSDMIAYLNNGYDFQLRISAPSNDDIEAIDDFFTSYGYNVNRFAVPNLKVKSDFTFVKTKDAVVYSAVNKAAEQMAAMLNSGTKFWVGEIGK